MYSIHLVRLEGAIPESHNRTSTLDPHLAAQPVKQALVVDVDNTLTPPRRPLEREMASALKRLKVPFFLGAGGDLRLIREQFIEPLYDFGYRGSFDAFLCNGATRYHFDLRDEVSIRRVRHFELRTYLGAERFEKLLHIVEGVLDREEFRLPPPLRIIGERIVDRESMINVAPIGRPRERLGDEAHRNRDLFKEYDHATQFRKRFLNHLRQELAGFAADGIYISLGGETSFDVVIRGNDKSFPLRTLIDEGFKRIWYVGDALFEGGNDEAVLHYIQQWTGEDACPVEAVKVQTWRETMGVLQGLGIIGNQQE